MNDYELLGVTPQSTFEEVKHNYRELSKRYHPDNKKTGNEEMFKRINEAYTRITDHLRAPNPEENVEYQNQVQFNWNPNIDYHGILEDYIIYSSFVKQSVEFPGRSLYTYIQGKLNGLTSHGLNYRKKISEVMSPEMVNALVGSDPFTYSSNVMNNPAYSLNNSFNPLYAIFIISCRETYMKYGKKQLAAALDEAMNGNYSFFTNGNRGIRDLMQNTIEPRLLYQFVLNKISDNTVILSNTLGGQAADVLASEFMSQGYYHQKAQ